MVIKILWLIVILIYLYCFFYKMEVKEKFNLTKPNKMFSELDNNHDEIKKKIIYGLKVIDKLFNKHNIYYTAGYGTLLGAVRHWDMIPWDDDGDLNVWRQDYSRIMNLKDEFKANGLILESDWKLIKVYFNDKKYPFIDLFINDIKDGKVIRCSEPFDKSCKSLDKVNDWWWKWVNYPSQWITERKRLKFGPIEIWCPIESEKILKYWYGETCLSECKSPEYDHITSDYIKPKILSCGILPKPQL